MLLQVLEGGLVQVASKDADFDWTSFSWQQSNVLKTVAIEQLKLNQLGCNEIKVVQIISTI